MTDGLEGQAAVVTGGTSGIGRAVCEAMLEAGMKVVLTGRRADSVDLAHPDLRAVAADATDPEAPGQLLEAALDAFGRCDVLVNNAGMIETGTIDEIDLERVTAMVRINVEAAFRMAYVFLRHFKAQDRGHLVNTSSVLGFKTRPTAGAYAGTKYAIEALSEALRLELVDSRVKVSCVEPGLVMTGLHAHMPVHPSEMMGIDQPLQPADIARAVMFQLAQADHVHIPRILVVPKASPL